MILIRPQDRPVLRRKWFEKCMVVREGSINRGNDLRIRGAGRLFVRGEFREAVLKAGLTGIKFYKEVAFG